MIRYMLTCTCAYLLGSNGRYAGHEKCRNRAAGTRTGTRVASLVRPLLLADYSHVG